jgi:hypothetical protein
VTARSRWIICPDRLRRVVVLISGRALHPRIDHRFPLEGTVREFLCKTVQFDEKRTGPLDLA